jgi:anti-sigma-K factor RskA
MEPGIHELSAAYALDALDERERAEFEAHLRDCERCREDVRAFAGVAESLALATQGPEPSPELRGRILAAAAAEPQNVVSLGVARERRRRNWTPALGAVAAVAACAAIGLGIYSITLSGDLDDARTALAEQRGTSAVLADPAARTVALAAGEGKLVVNRDGDAVLVLDMVEPAPEGKTYEVWIVEDETPRPAGLFAGDEGTDIVRVDGPVKPGSLVAVTLEDAGGAEAPTTTPIVASKTV